MKRIQIKDVPKNKFLQKIEFLNFKFLLRKGFMDNVYCEEQISGKNRIFSLSFYEQFCDEPLFEDTSRKIIAPLNLTWKKHKDIEYLFELNDDSINILFAIKNKHNIELDNHDEFFDALQKCLNTKALYIIPQSSYSKNIDGIIPIKYEHWNPLQSILKNIPYAVLDKKPKEEIFKNVLANNKFSKLEITSMEKSLAEMKDAFQIHKIKNNKRKHFAPHIYYFDPIDLKEIKETNQEIILLDDSYVTGETFNALCKLLDEHDIKYKKQVLFLQKYT